MFTKPSLTSSSVRCVPGQSLLSLLFCFVLLPVLGLTPIRTRARAHTHTHTHTRARARARFNQAAINERISAFDLLLERCKNLGETERVPFLSFLSDTGESFDSEHVRAE